MDLPLDHLRTLAAVVDVGSLEKAAERLRVTPSAVSQRIRAIEQRVGRIVLQRTRPVQATAAGAPLVRLARQLALLEHDALSALGDDAHEPTIALAVNSDSLLTWFLPVLSEIANGRGASIEIHREDELRTAQLLADGTVMGAVTAQREPVAGCLSSPLGSLRYFAVATTEFAKQWFPDGPTPEALRRSPVVHFDRHDTLQTTFTARHGVEPEGRRHVIGASAEFGELVRMGLGWGMLMPGQFDEGIADGSLTLLSDEPVVVPLRWQRWNLASGVLDAVTDAVEAAAAASAALAQPSS